MPWQTLKNQLNSTAPAPARELFYRLKTNTKRKKRAAMQPVFFTVLLIQALFCRNCFPPRCEAPSDEKHTPPLSYPEGRYCDFRRELSLCGICLWSGGGRRLWPPLPDGGSYRVYPAVLYLRLISYQRVKLEKKAFVRSL